MPYDRPPLANDVRVGLFFATAVGTLAIAGGVAVTVSYALSHHFSEVRTYAREFALAEAAVLAAYYTAGGLAGLCYWLLRPVSDSPSGQRLIVFVEALIVYGSVGFSLILLYVIAGVNIATFRSPAEAWRNMGIGVVLIAVVFGMMGPTVFRRMHGQTV